MVCKDCLHYEVRDCAGEYQNKKKPRKRLRT